MVKLFCRFDSKWTKIAALMPGRSYTSIKNRMKQNLTRRLTESPFCDIIAAHKDGKEFTMEVDDDAAAKDSVIPDNLKDLLGKPTRKAPLSKASKLALAAAKASVPEPISGRQAAASTAAEEILDIGSPAAKKDGTPIKQGGDIMKGIKGDKLQPSSAFRPRRRNSKSSESQRSRCNPAESLPVIKTESVEEAKKGGERANVTPKTRPSTNCLVSPEPDKADPSNISGIKIRRHLKAHYKLAFTAPAQRRVMQVIYRNFLKDDCDRSVSISSLGSLSPRSFKRTFG